jgi:hypothetical protein
VQGGESFESFFATTAYRYFRVGSLLLLSKTQVPHLPLKFAIFDPIFSSRILIFFPAVWQSSMSFPF